MEVAILSIDTSHPLYPEWLALRRRLLREPLGIDFTETELEAEEEDRQVLALVRDRLAGGLLVRTAGMSPGVWKVRQVAVDPEFQSKGVGRRLMENVIEEARVAGVDEILLHSRETVCEFYEKLGFSSLGERFEEVGISHRKMGLRPAFP